MIGRVDSRVILASGVTQLPFEHLELGLQELLNSYGIELLGCDLAWRVRDSYRILQRGFFQTLLASLRLHTGGLSATTGLAEAANSFDLTEGLDLGHRLPQGLLLWEGVFLAE
jgi:hypothetical protein